jgi:hypothetical protein
MKLRAVVLPILAALLLTAGVARALPAPAGISAPTASPAVSFSGPAACDSSRFTLNLAGLAPETSSQLTPCAACSDSHCLGHNLGGLCAAFNFQGRCQIQDMCPSGGWTCQCLPGPF